MCTDPVCVVSLAEQGSGAAQGEAGRCLCCEARSQQEHGGRAAAKDAMPQVRGVPADRVRRVPLLQGHEEVRGARQDEAVLHHEAVHRCKCAQACRSAAESFPRCAWGWELCSEWSLKCNRQTCVIPALSAQIPSFPVIPYSLQILNQNATKT